MLIAFPAYAEDNVKLFSEYYAGMSREDVEKTGIWGALNINYMDVLARDRKVEALGLEWLQLLILKDNRLRAVGLLRAANIESGMKVLAELEKSHLYFIYLKSREDELDMLPVYRAGTDALKPNIERFFMQSAHSASVEITFIDSKAYSSLKQDNSITSARQLLETLPNTLVTKYKASRNPPFLALIYTIGEFADYDFFNDMMIAAMRFFR